MSNMFVWYDDNPKKSVSTKVTEAVERYEQKFGRHPQVCILNEQAQALLKTSHMAGLELRFSKSTPQNYFWVGRN